MTVVKETQLGSFALTQRDTQGAFHLKLVSAVTTGSGRANAARAVSSVTK